MEIFRAENIHKSYANHKALDGVSILVNKGSIYGLLGPNGAGKTSLIRIINQITAPDKGELFFNGKKLKSNDIYNIGYLPEERGLYKKMKVGEQAVYLARLKGLTKQEAVKKLNYWFEKFEIINWWNRKVEELSKGMQQKIQFIVTILHEPELLIFDEPFSGFDPINTNLLKAEILNLKNKGTTIIFSTHNMESVEELCDDITLINNAKNILSGNINKIKQSYKSNIYNFRFSKGFDHLNASLSHQYKILEHKKNEYFETLKIEVLDEKLNTNNLISHLMQFGTLLQFDEKLPTMNDIFIKLVEQTN
ncbi:MAG: ABC transporter ATP-binding protein [Bacteroidetes bacterium]|nr:MAG: ABC transporter ATP-binding protein [Bacteroidota bacterium]